MGLQNHDKLILYLLNKWSFERGRTIRKYHIKSVKSGMAKLINSTLSQL